MDNDKKQYDVAKLSEKEIQKLHTLEEKMRAKKGEEVILIAYQEGNPKNQLR